MFPRNIFSVVPHLRPENKKSNCIPMNNPMAQVYKNVIFGNKIDVPTILD